MSASVSLIDGFTGCAGNANIPSVNSPATAGVQNCLAQVYGYGDEIPIIQPASEILQFFTGLTTRCNTGFFFDTATNIGGNISIVDGGGEKRDLSSVNKEMERESKAGESEVDLEDLAARLVKRVQCIPPPNSPTVWGPIGANWELQRIAVVGPDEGTSAPIPAAYQALQLELQDAVAAVAGANRGDIASAQPSVSGGFGSAIVAPQGTSRGSNYNTWQDVAAVADANSLQELVIHVIRDMGIRSYTAGIYALTLINQNDMEVIRFVVVIGRAPRDDAPPA